MNPLIVSKKASVTLRCVLHIRNGSMPNIESTTHVNPVKSIASRFPISRDSGFRKSTSAPPVAAVTAMLTANSRLLESP